MPDPALGHLLWQTVAGAWPLERERLHGYLEKAVREAGTRTRWTDPDEAFEAAMHLVADACYDDPALRAAITGLVEQITPPGWSNSLSATLLQLAMPGVPDTYQGCELWDYSLVDPDNRRPVDFTARRELLERLDAGWLPEVDATGAAKLLMVSRALRARREHPERFTDYAPVLAYGDAGEHAVAFERRGVIAVATRLPVGLAARGGWGNTILPLPGGSWTDALTGTRVHGTPELSRLLSRYPAALLTRL